MTIGPDRIANVGLGTRSDDSANDDSVDKLMSYSDNILRGRVWTNPGTDEVRLYSCRLSYREAPQTQFRRGMFGQKTETTSHGEQTHLDFKIADGRGGDIAPNRFLNKDNPQDEEPIRRQQEYRDRLDESVGLIVVMPMDKDGFKIDLANRLVREIQRTIEFRKTAPDLPDLERVAICYTKYDELFTHRGASAGEKAGDANEAVDHLYNTAIVEVFRPLFAQAQQPDGFDICIFAVSTFGFVNGRRATNMAGTYKYHLGIYSKLIAGYDPAGPIERGSEARVNGMTAGFPVELFAHCRPTLFFAGAPLITDRAMLESW